MRRIPTRSAPPRPTRTASQSARAAVCRPDSACKERWLFGLPVAEVYWPREWGNIPCGRIRQRGRRAAMILARLGRDSIAGITSRGLRRFGEQGRSIPFQVASPQESGTLTGAGQASNIARGAQHDQAGCVRHLGHLKGRYSENLKGTFRELTPITASTSSYLFPLAPLPLRTVAPADVCGSWR